MKHNSIPTQYNKAALKIDFISVVYVLINYLQFIMLWKCVKSELRQLNP
jgi:hypothetical protein